MQVLEEKIGYNFNNKDILVQACTHSSYSHENNSVKDNERLEFLGDAVLELTVSDYLYNNFPHLSEGQLTKLRASIVCEGNLAKVGRNIGIGNCLKLGRGEEQTGGRLRDSIVSDAFEAIIGAVFLDGGFESAKKILTNLVLTDVEDFDENFVQSDYKTKLQEIIQGHSKKPVIYNIISESGPDHEKCFISQAMHNGKELGRGKGKSKKDAERAAAYQALKKMGEHK